MNWLTLYRLATKVLGPLIPVYLSRRLKRGKEDPTRFPERLGIANQPRPEGPIIWLHGASVGESQAMLPVIKWLRENFPDLTPLITTGTVTSAALMSERLPTGAIHQYVPADRRDYVRKFLTHWRPDFAIWVESEFWPNLITETKKTGIPMVVINGRMSQASFENWTKRKSLITPLLASFDLCLVQDDMEAERFSKLGARNIQTVGNLKFAAAPLPVDTSDFITYDHALTGRPRWLAASTFEGEELLAGQIHAELKSELPELLTIIAPRHPDRGNAITEALRGLDLNVAQRSAKEELRGDTDVYVADTIGELGLFYRLAPLVFMGKSLTEKGGQNPLEPALLNCALIHGPHMGNFPAITRDLVSGNISWQVEDGDELKDAVHRLLTTPMERRQRAERARTYAESQTRVLDDTITALAPLIQQVLNARA